MPTMQMSGEVVISVNAIVAPGREQEFLHVMSTAASESRMEPGCVCFQVSKLPGERAYMFYEVYQDDAAVEFHKGTPHYQAWNKFRESGGVQSLNAQVCDGVFIAPDAYTAYAEHEQELRAHAHMYSHDHDEHETRSTGSPTRTTPHKDISPGRPRASAIPAVSPRSPPGRGASATLATAAFGTARKPRPRSRRRRPPCGSTRGDSRPSTARWCTATRTSMACPRTREGLASPSTTARSRRTRAAAST